MVTIAEDKSTAVESNVVEELSSPLGAEARVVEELSSLKALNDTQADLNTMGHDGKLLIDHAEKIRDLVASPDEEGSNEE